MRLRGHCWLRLRRHDWGEPYLNRIGWHRYKDCRACGRHKMTAHVGCPKACWGGPG